MYYFSSESVTKGHPDKVADYISDSILDSILEIDSNARVAVETAVTTNTVLIMGEVTTSANISYEKIVREALISIGYNDDKFDFNGSTVDIIVKIDKQSKDIAMGVDGIDQGAGDQGLMFGFAKNDGTKSLMPLPIELSHKLTERLTFVREQNIIKNLGPDGKAQVTVCYDENDLVNHVSAVVVSTQHGEEWELEKLREEVLEKVIKAVIPSNLLTNETKFFINPTGRFVQGGPNADSGLTGRKIIVDTYGGYARHGGGAFSGKDPSKVDRSAAYMARYLAKNIVKSNIATKCEIQLAYAIGVSSPVSFFIDCFGTNKVSVDLIKETVLNNFNLTPKGIIDFLDLKRPIYKKTVNFGHFGREDSDFTWELTNKIDIFTKLL